MKRMWAALALTLFTVCLGVFGLVHTRNVTSQMVRTVSAARAAGEAGERGEAYSFSRQAVEDWKNAHRILCLYMIHSRLEAIDQTLAALPELCREDEMQEFFSQCDCGILQIDYLNESEIPNLDNIF
jgi:hypothetical protein